MQENKVSKKSITFWRIRLYISAFVCAVTVSLLTEPFSLWWYVFTAIWCAAFLFLYFFYYPLKYRRLSYSVDENGLLRLNDGVIYKYEKYINIKNIQYVNFVQSPVQRLMKLCGADIIAAGGRIYIPCLDTDSRQEFLRLIGRS